jgi:hypothetical protein
VKKVVKKKMSAGNSSNSSVSGRSSSNSSDTSAETVTRQQPHVFNLSQSPQQPMYYQYYRRQTPEEDYLSTQQGIEILVKQRQQLVDQLTKHYRKLYRSNQIENLLQFSQQLDSIMKLRGFSIVPSPNPSSRARRRLALPPMERGVTIHDQKF